MAKRAIGSRNLFFACVCCVPTAISNAHAGVFRILFILPPALARGYRTSIFAAAAIGAVIKMFETCIAKRTWPSSDE
ncbi:MAG TPA: hypothetical protein EYG03_13070 [Planctomycetes bacterium]|nr:hypothetical protein [Fuerstiella sp.]HIK92895.1 hypothetical protein [Planctomycetota bacterium]